MAQREYCCNRFPHLSIGDRIQFHGGLFVTEDPALQEQIELNDWWGIHIHPRETEEEIAAAESAAAEAPAAPSAEAEPEQPRVRTGRRGTK